MTLANRTVPALFVFVFLCTHVAFAQVGPAEIKNPVLKDLEQRYLQDLVALNQSISEIKFPFKLSLNRHVGLDPKDQAAADSRGLEFVIFNERKLLKATANYNAAFNTDALTPNQRAGRVLQDVILPVLRILPDHFSPKDPFDGFGFEIGYHIRKHNRAYEYEGKEILVAVFDKADGLRYAGLTKDAERQEVLNRSEIYLSGEPFGLALGASAPIEIEALVHRPAKKNVAPVSAPQPDISPTNEKSQSVLQPESVKAIATGAGTPAVKIDIDALREKYQTQLDILHQEGTAKFQFVDYAPPAFVIVRDQPALQATLRNPETFDRDETSIYRRAARTFDLFLAPRLRWIVSKVPEDPDFGALDISILHDLTSAKSAKTSEAIEFIFPLRETRQFTAAEITNQDLINRSIVLVNGVRIALNLAQVE